MDFARLETHIVDMIKEEQIKLGYRQETIRLYYPLQSLNRLLAQKLDIEQMQASLHEFIRYAKDHLGEMQISSHGERFCFAIPPEGVDYVHDNTDENEFLCDFIKVIATHGCTIEDVLAQFHRHSDHVKMERIKNGEFDYLIYFEDGIPDDYRYCIADEGCHLIYHRFMPEDFEDFKETDTQAGE